jgi:hypothetical protein
VVVRRPQVIENAARFLPIAFRGVRRISPQIRICTTLRLYALHLNFRHSSQSAAFLPSPRYNQDITKYANQDSKNRFDVLSWRYPQVVENQRQEGCSRCAEERSLRENEQRMSYIVLASNPLY